MTRGSIFGVTPETSEIVQGSRSSAKRPEADRVSAIVAAVGPYATLPDSDYEGGRRSGVAQALESRAHQPSPYGPANVSGPDDPAFKEWQKGYEEGKESVEALFEE